MIYADRVEETSSVTNTTTITLFGAVTGARAFASSLSTGTSSIPVCVADVAGNWEIGTYTLTDSVTLSRQSVLSSSNAGLAVTFPAGQKSVFVTLPSCQIAKFFTVDDISFSSTVPLTANGNRYMPQQVVSSVLSFTVAASPIKGASVYVRLVADGVHTPTFTGMTEYGGSSGYDNRNGIVNIVQFFNDGYDTWYFITQAVNAVAIDVVAPTASTATVENATPTLIIVTMSETLDATTNPPSSTFTIPGHPISSTTISTNTVRLVTSTAFVNGEAVNVTYTPDGTNNLKDPSGNEMAGFTLAITDNVQAVDSTPPTFVSAQVANTSPTVVQITMSEALGATLPAASSFTLSGGKTASSVSISGSIVSVTANSAYAQGDTITVSYTQPGTSKLADPAGNAVASFGPVSVTNNVFAAASAPAQMSAPTATAGDSSASVAFTAPSNGGSAITGYTITSSPGGFTGTGTTSPITVSGLTNGSAYTFTATATNAIGTSTPSPASNSVTPIASSYPRFVSKTGLTETGTGPYTYTGTNAGTFTNQEACANMTLGASGVDGSLSMRFEQVSGNGMAFGLESTGPTYQPIGNMAVYLGITAGSYSLSAAASPVTVTANRAPAEGDIIRIRRSGTAVYAEVAAVASPTTFVEIGHWPTVNAVNKYFNLVVGSDAKITLLDAVGLV